MADPDAPGSRRILPAPGAMNLAAVEDANFAEAFGEPPPAEPSAAPAEPAGVTDQPVDAAEEPAGEPEAPGASDPSTPTDTSVSAVEAPPAESATPAPPEADADASGDEPPVEVPPATGEPAGTAQDGEGQNDEGRDLDSDDRPLADSAGAADTAHVSETATAEASTPAEDGEADEATDADATIAPQNAHSPDPAPLAPSPAVVETAREATRSRGREFVQLVVKYGKEHVPMAPHKPSVPDTGPPRMVGRVGQLIPFLRLVLALGFAASFWLGDVQVTLFGRETSLGDLLQVLTVSGLIGFLTNWLAITMLFQPREKRAIIPQGLIPAQRERVIYRLSEAISRELINAEIIKQKIQESGVIGRYRDLALGVVRGVVEDPEFRVELKALAQSYAQEVLGSEPVRREVARLAVEKVEEQAGQGLGGVALRLYRTFAEDDFQRRVDRALDELPDAVAPLLDRIDTALDAVPAKVEARADEIEEAATSAILSFVESFDVRTMISERARQFDEGQLERLLKSTSNEQLNYIKYLGAILGGRGGFVIWQPLGALAVFVTIGLALWAIDEAIVRARRAAP